MRTLIVSLILFLLMPILAFATDEVPPQSAGPMDVITYKTGGYETVGHIVAEDADSVTIIPERGGRLTVSRELIDKISYASVEPEWVSSDEMVEEFTSQFLKFLEEQSTFRVAKITDQTIYLNIGKGSVDRQGWKARIYREGEPIDDPITGDVLGYAKQFVGTIQIIGETSTYSEALPVNTPLSAFHEGDLGVFLRRKPTLVVANITTEDGNESEYGTMISESIIAKLSGNPNLILLERDKFGEVLDELAHQHAKLYGSEPETVSDENLRGNLSKLEGVDALLVGTVVPEGKETAIARDAGEREVTKTDRRTVTIRVLGTQKGVVIYSARYHVSDPQKPLVIENEPYRGEVYRGRGRVPRR